MNLEDATGMLICYRTWDDLDKYYDSLNKLNLPGTSLFKAFNQIEGVPYPFTLALVVVEGQASLDKLDDCLTDNSVDLGSDKEMYAGASRIKEFFGMIHIDKYPPGFLKIRYGRCERKATTEAACMFCHGGHMLECHFPKTCEEANCSHLEAYQ